jgi:hypothetical protein
VAAASFADAIQNALVALAVARPFPRLSYAVQGTGGAQTTTPASTLLPKTVLAWQDASEFDVPALNRRSSRLRERTTWTWFLQLQFDQPVSLVEFEAAVLQSAPRVLRDLSIGVDQQVDLLLQSAEYENPVAQQPSRGTKATYRFTAELTPY